MIGMLMDDGWIKVWYDNGMSGYSNTLTVNTRQIKLMEISQGRNGSLALPLSSKVRRPSYLSPSMVTILFIVINGEHPWQPYQIVQKSIGGLKICFRKWRGADQVHLHHLWSQWRWLHKVSSSDSKIIFLSVIIIFLLVQQRWNDCSSERLPCPKGWWWLWVTPFYEVLQS